MLIRILFNYLFDLRFGVSVSDRDSYLRDLELQIAEQRGRKEQEKQGKMDWWEKSKEPPFQVNPPQRPHPSQV